MQRKYFNFYAANKGITSRVVSEEYGIPYELFGQYDFPDKIENTPAIRAAFCCGYFAWDSNERLRIAKKYRLRELDQLGEGTYRAFVGIDEKINRLYQHIKVLKFGYDRDKDHAWEEIRTGVLTREKIERSNQACCIEIT